MRARGPTQTFQALRRQQLRLATQDSKAKSLASKMRRMRSADAGIVVHAHAGGAACAASSA